MQNIGVLHHNSGGVAVAAFATAFDFELNPQCLYTTNDISPSDAAEPTLSGEVVLDPFHPYGTVRHLRNKPVHAFTDEEQYLLVADAEKGGLLKVDFKVS